MRGHVGAPHLDYRVSPLLEARDVVKHYGDVQALGGVTLAVREGEFVSIIGPNGAGKTTLVNVLTGLLRPSSGRVTFKGRDVAGIGPVRLAALGMARSFQLVSVFPALTVAETLAVPALARLGRGGRPLASLGRDTEVRDSVAEMAALFGLADKLERLTRTLPQGDKKLLDVASAFALRPEVILMDEPTSGVSTGDKTAIMETYSDRIVALHQGRVLADATPDAIRADADVVATVIGKPL
jgi:branched-chain amino acid transport system ATP-binding protein